jgi:hypothetical protein
MNSDISHRAQKFSQKSLHFYVKNYKYIYWKYSWESVKILWNGYQGNSIKHGPLHMHLHGKQQTFHCFLL